MFQKMAKVNIEIEKFERHFKILFKIVLLYCLAIKNARVFSGNPQEKVILTMIVLKRFDDILALPYQRSRY